MVVESTDGAVGATQKRVLVLASFHMHCNFEQVSPSFAKTRIVVRINLNCVCGLRALAAATETKMAGRLAAFFTNAWVEEPVLVTSSPSGTSL